MKNCEGVPLKDLIEGVEIERCLGDRATMISGIDYHSKRIEPGMLFVAIPGHEEDGARFIPEALSRGARALMTTSPYPGVKDLPQLVVKDPRKTLSRIAARYYGEPSKKLRVIGVTGTNGKTTLTYLLESILTAAGRRVGVMGTINYRYAGKIFPAFTTTPESLDLQKFFHEMVEKGTTDVVMEVSSHSLDQGRVRGIHFDVAAFTNLTQDHLDYHPDMTHYRQAKLKLFTEFLAASEKPRKVAVVNRDDPFAEEILRSARGNLPKGEVLTTGVNERASLRPLSFQCSAEGTDLELDVEGEKRKIHSSLLGEFNVENILLAIGIARSLKVSWEAVAHGIEKLSGVPGRLEPIPNRRGIYVFVDYAHTPDALARVGGELKKFAKGRVITLFGCGGDRDRVKRPLMGKEAARFSDEIIVTSDNPRTEEPGKIIEEIVAGLKGFPNFKIVPDREEALKEGVSRAKRGDTLLVAGKGHEDYQILGKKKIHFSDQEILRKLLGAGS